MNSAVRGLDFLRRYSKSLIFVGVILAAALYTAGVVKNPPGFYIDESSISYNAYTISQTGRDEHGTAWPLFFRAFGDYKNPVYVYLLAGLFKLTGPSILVGRLFSAAAGLAGALLLGLLAAHITRRRAVGVLTSINALLTPWLFETSRVVMEVALFPLVLALFLFCLYRASLKKMWSMLDVVSLACALALLTYTYSIGRLLAPLLAIGLVLFMTRERWVNVVQTWGLYALTLIPLIVFHLRHPGALAARFNIITYLTPDETYGEAAQDFIKHFLGNLNPWRMLAAGDPNPDQIVHIYGTGHLLLTTALCAIFGGWLVLRRERGSAWWRFIFYGLIVSVIPASLTNDYFHMLRLIAVPVFLLVLGAPALAWFVEKVKEGRMWLTALATLLILTISQAALFQWRFHQSSVSPRRLHKFDAEYPQTIFAPALANPLRPIYLADALAIPGYIQAYWYATLHGIDLAQFVLLPSGESPREGTIVITTEENCPRCQIISRSEPYTLYLARGPVPLRTPLPDEGLRAEIYLQDPPVKMAVREQQTIRVRVKNVSASVWLGRERTGGPYQVSLGNHWFGADGLKIQDDGRSALPVDLRPGEEIELPLTINPPRKAGAYVLELDMVQEGVSWFGAKGSQTQKLLVRVE